MPVQTVMEKIADGSIASKVEAGFLFVDVLPPAPAAPATVEPPPATFMSLSDAELEAISTPADERATPAPFVAAEIKYTEDEEDGVEPFVDEESANFSAKDWRRVRAQVGRTRRAPGAALATGAA